MIEAPAIAPSGTLDLRIWRQGRLVEHSVQRNLIVDNSKLIHSRLLGGAVAGNSVVQIGFGSNVAAAAGSNVGLSVDAYIKAVDTISYPAFNQVAFALSLGAIEANGQTIVEYGLIVANGGLYARLVRAAPLLKDLSITINAIWTISF